MGPDHTQSSEGWRPFTTHWLSGVLGYETVRRFLETLGPESSRGHHETNEGLTASLDVFQTRLDDSPCVT